MPKVTSTAPAGNTDLPQRLSERAATNAGARITAPVRINTSARITVLDSTLRDGAQGEDISFSVSDKLRIVDTLDIFGLDFIEAGNPGSNPKDLEFFEKSADKTLRQAKLCAFGATRRANINVDDDANVQSILSADTPVVVIFGKSSLMHVTEILRTTPDENLAMIKETIAYFKKLGKTVIYDAEHFFDGYYDESGSDGSSGGSGTGAGSNRDASAAGNPNTNSKKQAQLSNYALKTLEVAKHAKADIIVLCDTNGGMLPGRIFNATRDVIAALGSNVEIGIHAHNDSGCAVANTLSAIEAGATHVQGTFIGFGERCGNADLSTILPALKLKMGLEASGDLALLVDTANKIAEISNVILPNNKPYVGASAFSHKAGMHADGVLKNPISFEHIDPKTVGNKRRFLVSEVAGRGGVLKRVKSFAPTLTKSSPELAVIIERLKELEHAGYQFEAADASFELMAKKVLGTYIPHFKVTFYKTMGEFPAKSDDMPSTATIEIEVDGKAEITAAKGQGPVHALDKALRKALTVFYPELNDMHLVDYKVRVLEQKASTAAMVRVLIESADTRTNWTTIGVSDDILEASFLALVDSLEYKLANEDQ